MEQIGQFVSDHVIETVLAAAIFAVVLVSSLPWIAGRFIGLRTGTAVAVSLSVSCALVLSLFSYHALGGFYEECLSYSEGNPMAENSCRLGNGIAAISMLYMFVLTLFALGSTLLFYFVRFTKPA